MRSLSRDVSRLRGDLPGGTLDPSTCAQCHRALHATVVRQFESSAMGMPGTQNPRVEQRPTVTCTDSHGTHSEDKAREYLHSADAHKLAGEALVIEAREILAALRGSA